MRNDLPWICEIDPYQSEEGYVLGEDGASRVETQYISGLKCVVVKPEEIAWVEREGRMEKFGISALWDILGNDGLLELRWDQSTDSPVKKDGLVIINL